MSMTEETWVDCPFYEGRYLISNRGRVFSLHANKIMKFYQNNKGYISISLTNAYGKKRTESIHRLVAFAFIGEPPEGKTEVGHLNNIPSDNNVDNLVWCSHQENEQWKWETNPPEHLREMLRKRFIEMNQKNRDEGKVAKVRCIETGIVYESSYFAEKELGVNRNSINKVIKGQGQTAGGYHWEVVNNN